MVVLRRCKQTTVKCIILVARAMKLCWVSLILALVMGSIRDVLSNYDLNICDLLFFSNLLRSWNKGHTEICGFTVDISTRACVSVHDWQSPASEGRLHVVSRLCPRRSPTAHYELVWSTPAMSRWLWTLLWICLSNSDRCNHVIGRISVIWVKLLLWSIMLLC